MGSRNQSSDGFMDRLVDVMPFNEWQTKLIFGGLSIPAVFIVLGVLSSWNSIVLGLVGGGYGVLVFLWLVMVWVNRGM